MEEKRINIELTISEHLKKVLNTKHYFDIELRKDNFAVITPGWSNATQAINNRVISYMQEIGFKFINSGIYISIFSYDNLNNFLTMLKLRNEVKYLPTNFN